MKLIKDNKKLIEELFDKDDLLKERLGLVQHMKQVINYHDRASGQEREEAVSY